MIYFLDASAWVKRYVAEAGSEDLRSLLRRRTELAASRLSAVEVPAALARRARDGHVANDVAKTAAARFLQDFADVRVVEPRGRVVALATDLVWRHALRAYDSMQLASALHFTRETSLAVTVVCSDANLCSAAVAEGVRRLKVA